MTAVDASAETPATTDGTNTTNSTNGLARRRWQPWALGAICVVACVLYAWGIGSSWGNAYYSAAVKSMASSFENFLFGSFDAAGVVTVDKPPMALWAQVISVKLFGYNQFAVLFPQVVLGVAAVFVLHRTVRRWAGEHAALLAALVLAVSPVTVVINRDNNPDTLLVLLVVGAAYAMTRAFDARRSTAWVAMAAFLIGCGFLTKMLQAWMVLPAFVVAYLVGSKASWGRRIADLGVAAVVLVISSFWWVAVTALWPEPKPYIGGSEDGTAWDLVFGYNGFGRILGNAGPGGAGTPDGGSGGPGGPGDPGGPFVRVGGGFGGETGWTRLFGGEMGGQISWLLPLCGLVLVAMLVTAVLRKRAGATIAPEQAAGWVMWGGWLVVVGLTFSFAQGIIHAYYTTMLAPSVGAIVGAGLVRFWGWYRARDGWSWLLLPAGVAITVAWAFAIVTRSSDWNAWAGYLAVAMGVAAVVMLALGRRAPRQFARAGLVLGLVAVLTVPTAWSAIAAVSGEGGRSGTNPMAGPSTDTVGGPGSGPGGMPAPQPEQRMRSNGGPGGHNGSLNADQRNLLDYVKETAGDATVPLAVDGGAGAAASYIINSDLPIVGMGGFSGRDDAPTVSQLESWRSGGELGYVLLGGRSGIITIGPGGPGNDQAGRRGGPPGGPTSRRDDGGTPRGTRDDASSERQQWVENNCTKVDAGEWGGSTGSGLELYSCR